MDFRITSEQADSQRSGDPIRFRPELRSKVHHMARQQVSLERLFAILEGEYGKARPALCRACVTPLPIRRIPADEVSTNWFVLDPDECPHQCNVVLAEIVTKLMSLYELGRSEYGSGANVLPLKGNPS